VFRRLTPEISDQGLTIGGTPIVGYWERDLQQTLVRRTVSAGERVLEIGYGLGIASSAIASLRPVEHLIIEAHPVVASMAESAATEGNIRVICGYWQEQAMPAPAERFDSAIFDPYPIEASDAFDGSLERTREFVIEFLECARSWVLPAGRVGFLDFSCRLSADKQFAQVMAELRYTFDYFCEPLPRRRADYAPMSEAHIIVVTLR
jgi:hypothetical protein